MLASGFDIKMLIPICCARNLKLRFHRSITGGAGGLLAHCVLVQLWRSESLLAVAQHQFTKAMVPEVMSSEHIGNLLGCALVMISVIEKPSSN